MLINNINPNKLHNELITIGIVPILVQTDIKNNEYIASNTWITFANDVDMAVVQAVIGAHNPELLPPKLTEEEQRITDLELAMAEILGGGL